MISAKTRQVAGKFRLSFGTLWPRWYEQESVTPEAVEAATWMHVEWLTTCWQQWFIDIVTFRKTRFLPSFECAFFFGRGRSRSGGGRGDGIGAELSLGEQLQDLPKVWWEDSSPSKKLQQTTEIIATACTFNHLKFGLVFWDVLPSVLVSYRNCTVQSFVHDLAETCVKFTRWHGTFRGAHHRVNVFINFLGSKHCKSTLYSKHLSVKRCFLVRF